MATHPPRYAGGPCFVCGEPWPCFERQLSTLAASVQFVRPIFFRVIRVHDDWHTYHGWLWLDGYQPRRRA
ncbi:hypothetical protein [Micromonospora haikouensis]|uniref:hypothetical protein n=1 Tax=Micromonospora haikouensis TaxID=686309 RepID=UPI003D70731C